MDASIMPNYNKNQSLSAIHFFEWFIPYAIEEKAEKFPEEHLIAKSFLTYILRKLYALNYEFAITSVEYRVVSDFKLVIINNEYALDIQVDESKNFEPPLKHIYMQTKESSAYCNNASLGFNTLLISIENAYSNKWKAFMRRHNVFLIDRINILGFFTLYQVNNKKIKRFSCYLESIQSQTEQFHLHKILVNRFSAEGMFMALETFFEKLGQKAHWYYEENQNILLFEFQSMYLINDHYITICLENDFKSNLRVFIKVEYDEFDEKFVQKIYNVIFLRTCHIFNFTLTTIKKYNKNVTTLYQVSDLWNKNEFVNNEISILCNKLIMLHFTLQEALVELKRPE